MRRLIVFIGALVIILSVLTLPNEKQAAKPAAASRPVVVKAIHLDTKLTDDRWAVDRASRKNDRTAAHLLEVKRAKRQAARQAAREAAAEAARQAEVERQARVAASTSDVKQYALDRIGAEQFACLDELWLWESGWDPHNMNESSGAYGIPQALPGSKMASAGSDWADNPYTQVRWGLGYIDGRYGNACGALQHSYDTAPAGATYGWY